MNIKIKKFNNVSEIKKAVDEGKTVFRSNSAYKVIKSGKNGDYLISCGSNNFCIGLTWGITGKEAKIKYPDRVKRYFVDPETDEILNDPIEEFYMEVTN